MVDLLKELEEKRGEVRFLEGALSDPDVEMANMAKEEIGRAREEVARLEDTILRHLLPKDDEDHGGVILEVRGVGLG